MFLTEGEVARTPAAIAAPQDADQAIYPFHKDITCHATTDDDVINEGPSLSSSGRAHCVQPYSGPPAP